MSKARGATVDQLVKLIVGAGQASPSPPVGPALGSKGVKSMDFCKVRPLPSHYQGLLSLVVSCFGGCTTSASEYLRALSKLTVLTGVQRKDITHQRRHTTARPGHCPARPIIPLRRANSANLMAAAQRSRSTDGQEGKEERCHPTRP